MSSGYFPVTPKHDEYGEKLAQARQLILGVVDSWHGGRVYLNAEDQASDQSYVDKLYSALAHINACMSVDETDAAAVDEQIRQAETRQADAERDTERWRAIKSKLAARQFADKVQQGIKNFVES